MWFRTLLDSMKQRRSGTPIRRTPHRPTAARLRVEALEDRCMPSTFTVLSLLDNGPDSLRAAVVAANANPGADAINFATTGTIALTSGQLDITDSLTINGPGADALSVSGENNSRVFAIAGDPTVLIAGLTVANGWTTDSPGGGISMAGGTVTLDHVTVTGNYAVAAPGAFEYWYDPSVGYSATYSVGNGVGGGLYVAGGTLTLDQCTVSGNYAIGGAGYTFYYSGHGGGGEGGGLYVAGGTVHVNQTTISSNYADGGHGGDDDQGNSGYGGDGGGAAGGGIRVVGGSLEIHQSSIFDNGAFGGSGGYGSFYYGKSGLGYGGGLSIATAAPPRADLDTDTVSNTINNIADIDPNISGPYTSNGAVFNPTLVISDVSTLEGNTGAHAITFTVSVSAASNQPITVAYYTAAGAYYTTDSSASADSDYQAASGTLTIPAGQTTGTVTVLVNGDRLAEPNETFFVNLSSATNATIVDGQGVGTVLDDEPRISINDVRTKEGNSGLTAFAFTVSLSVPYDVPVTVDYATANGTATAGSDYQAASGTLTIPAGQTSGTITVPVTGDRLPEPDKYFFINLSNLNFGAIADSQGFGSIVDDEPHVSISDVTKREGRNNTTLFTFTVTLSAAYDEPVTVSYRTADGTATTSDGDYIAKTGTLTFAPGETTKTITIEVKGDSKKETDETFYLDLFGNSSNSLFTKNRGLGMILNDD
jgi:Calx-beta domain-containing protein